MITSHNDTLHALAYGHAITGTLHYVFEFEVFIASQMTRLCFKRTYFDLNYAVTEAAW